MSDEIIGRARELAELDAFLDRIGHEARGLVLEGEPGIGKTRLWRAGIEGATERGHTVLVARPGSAESHLPFATLGDLLGGVLDGALPALPRPQRRALESALLLTEAAGPIDQRAIGLGCLGVLRAVAASSPTVVAIDDLHWVDPVSARALEFALRRLGPERVGILLARRPREMEADFMTPERALREERIAVTRVGPLTLGAIFELLRSRLDLTLPRPTLRQVHEASGGNPFYALEFGRALLRRGPPAQSGESGLPIPPSLQELVRERLAQLDSDALRVLGAVALLPEATVPVVQAACEAVDVALDAAAAEGVVELEGERIRFAHPLLATGVLSLLGLRERRDLHMRLAKSMHDRLDGARHRALAAGHPNADLAEELDEAANRAVERGAADLAVELGTLAIQLTPVSRPEERNRRRLATALFRYRTGAIAQMREDLEALIADLPPGRQRALALRWLAVSRDDDFDAAVELCERARAEAGDDAELRYEIESFLPIVWIVRGDIATAARHARAALRAADELGDETRRVVAIALLGLLETWLGHAPVALLERGVQLERRIDPTPDFYGSPTVARARRLLYVGSLDDARVDFESTLRTALERGDEPSQVGCHLALSELECRAGNWDAADAHARAGYELTERQGARQSEAALLYGRALVDAHRGLVDQARAEATRAVEQSERVKSGLFQMQSASVLGFVELSLGNVVAADTHLARLPTLLSESGYRDPGVCPCFPNAIEAALGVHEVERARRLVEDFEEQANAADNAWARAAASRCRGLVLSADGRLEEALAALAESVRLHEQLPMPFELARTRLSCGVVERRLGHKRAARESLEEALAVFENLGAPLWRNKTRSELARIGGRAAPRSGELTETERLIANLVAAGRTNTEVATELSLSARTVQWNLTKIYRKLRVRSRTELAASLVPGE